MINVGHGKNRFVIRIYLLFVAVFFLQGCIDVASTGAQAIYNRHGWQKNFNNQYLSMKVSHELLFATQEFKNCNITITAYNGDVLLAGQVPEAWQKEKAGEITKRVAGVKDVYNTIMVASPSSALTKVSDTWITGKVKAKLLANDDIDATQIKVVTENGTVYLLGTLTPDEANMAVDIAANTAGVQQVVRMFSYIHIDKRLS